MGVAGGGDARGDGGHAGGPAGQVGGASPVQGPGEEAAERDRGLVQVFLGQHGLADEGARLQAGPPLGFADVEQFGGGDLAGLSVRGGHEGSNTRGGRERGGAGTGELRCCELR